MDIKRIEDDISKCVAEYSRYKNDPANKAYAENMKIHAVSLFFQKGYHEYLLGKAGRDMRSRNISDITADPDMLISDIIIDTIEGYDPQKSDNYFAYFYTRYNYKLLDYGKETSKDSKRRMQINVSKNDDEKEVVNDPLEKIAVDDISELVIRTEYPEKFFKLLSMFTKFSEHNTGKSANEKRFYYSGLFTTDRSVSMLKEFPSIAEDVNENEYMDSINLDFLDFFMSEECLDIDSIIRCSLKKNAELMDNCPDNIKDREAEQPLRPGVYRKFIYQDRNEQISDAAFSQQKKSFEDLLKKILSV